MLSKVDLYGPTIVGVALVDVVAAILVGAGWVLTSADVGRPSSPYSGSCSLRRPGIVPSGSGVVPRSWRLLLAVWIF